ncbi:MAG: radical SAM protein [Polyangiaceae bacterium]
MELTLFVDHQCNLRCSYCYNGEKFNRRMSSDTMRRAVDMVIEQPLNHLDLSFFGGEPLIHPEFLRETVDYVERAFSERREPAPTLRFIVNTNATLIDDDTIDWMRTRSVTAFVSVDGPRDVHDRYRVDAGGRGSFDKTLAGIERLRAARIPTQIMVVFGPHTAARLGDAFAAVLGLGAEKIQLSANYRADWTDAAIDRLRSGLDAAGDVWIEHFRAGHALPVAPLHGKILSHLKGGIPCPSRCRLGGNEIAIAPSGRIYPCPQMIGDDSNEALVIGHVDTGVDPDALARLDAQKARAAETCAPCDLRGRCISDCGCRQVALTGELGRITATLCEIEAAYIDAADRVAEILYAESNPTFLDYFYRRNWQPAPGAQLIPLRRREA